MIILTYAFIKIFFNINFEGKNEWSEGHIIMIIDSIADVENVKNDNLNLLIVPQYGRNLNHTG